MSTDPGEVPPLEEQVEALTPGARVGRWRVVERLGVGGQGAVYRVEDLDHPGEFYALKLALQVRDGRAEREQVLLMAQAAHPHVVRFHGCARWPHPREGAPGFVMDWAPGLALDVWAEQEGTTFRAFTNASATVADTLGVLHARGVFHRDLKPEHILIRAADGQPVLLDFGASWYAGAIPLTPGPLPPTTRYLLSPEAVQFLWRSPEHPGARYDFRPTDDLYALGVCLYRATTGRYPFSEWLSPDVLCWAIAHVPPPAPVFVNPRVPRVLSDIIVRLLAKDPGARYPSGAALQAALLAAARGTEAAWDASLFASVGPRAVVPAPIPVPAAPPAPSEPGGARWRRWTGGLGLAAVVLLVLAPRVPPSVCGASEPIATLPTQGKADSVPAQGSQAPRPSQRQKLAPCKAQLEVEVSGACWLSLEQRPPNCPPETVAHQGRCLLPVARPPRAIPTSVEE